MIKTAMLRIGIEYNDEVTDCESVASALDKLLETAMSTPGILDEYGYIAVGDFFVIWDGKENNNGMVI